MSIKKDTIKATVSDLFSDFCYYDRKEDEDLTVEDMENISSIISKEELVKLFLDEIDLMY